MTTLTYPSPVFPGRPELHLEVPDDWQAVPATGPLAGAALAAVRPGPEEEFAPNFFVIVTELLPGHTVQADLDGVAGAAADRTDAVVGEVYARNVSGVTFFGRDLSYVDPVAGTLRVSNLFGFLRSDADGTLARISVTATVSAVRGHDDYVAVHRILNGLSVTPAPGTTCLIDEEAGQ